MAMDVFAHTCFGVVLKGACLAQFQAAYDKAEAALSKADAGWADDLDEDETVAAVLARLPAKTLAAVRKAVGAPPDAAFIWTGSDDDRLGRCATEAEAWVVGYGLFPYLDQVLAMWANGKPAPDCQSWVTGG